MDDYLIQLREAWLVDNLLPIPSLLEHMRELVVPIAAAGTAERVGGSHVPPAPLNLAAADDADRLWSHLCDFADLVGARIGDTPPITGDRMIRQRSPADIAARAQILVRWLQTARYRICTDPYFEAYFHPDNLHIVRVSRRAQHRYPLEDKPLPSRFRCKECGEHTVTVRYGVLGGPTGFSCSACSHEELI